MARRDSCRGRPKSIQNNARLGLIAVDRLLDGRGNWTGHEACAHAHFGVSSWWLARCHARAIYLSHMAVKRMTKGEIMSSPNSATLISRIRLPEECLLSTTRFLQSANFTAVVDVECVVEHGLSGMPSNRTKVVKQIKFSEFVRAHRSPTIRTADKNGHSHGASFYLDAKLQVLRNSRRGSDTRELISGAFNVALVAAGLPKVHSDNSYAGYGRCLDRQRLRTVAPHHLMSTPLSIRARRTHEQPVSCITQTFGARSRS